MLRAAIVASLLLACPRARADEPKPEGWTLGGDFGLGVCTRCSDPNMAVILGMTGAYRMAAGLSLGASVFYEVSRGESCAGAFGRMECVEESLDLWLPFGEVRWFPFAGAGFDPYLGLGVGYAFGGGDHEGPDGTAAGVTSTGVFVFPRIGALARLADTVWLGGSFGRTFGDTTSRCDGPEACQAGATGRFSFFYLAGEILVLI